MERLSDKQLFMVIVASRVGAIKVSVLTPPAGLPEFNNRIGTLPGPVSLTDRIQIDPPLLICRHGRSPDFNHFPTANAASHGGIVTRWSSYVVDPTNSGVLATTRSWLCLEYECCWARWQISELNPRTKTSHSNPGDRRYVVVRVSR